MSGRVPWRSETAQTLSVFDKIKSDHYTTNVQDCLGEPKALNLNFGVRMEVFQVGPDGGFRLRRAGAHLIQRRPALKPRLTAGGRDDIVFHNETRGI
jgi:hypothetical protein